MQIIGQEAVYSQEELQARLRQMGIDTTQATLSRDLKALHIIKVPGEGYRLPHMRSALPGLAPQGLVSIEFSGKNAVIKTQPGFAGAVGSAIDQHPSKAVMGTIAGDDTVLIIIREGFGPEETLACLTAAFPHIEDYWIK